MIDGALKRGVAVALPLILVGLLLFLRDEDGRPGGRERVSYVGLTRAAPIPGELSTLDAAKAFVSFPIPILPPAVLADPCSTIELPVSLVQVWASSAEVPEDIRQVGLTYTHGLWMSVSSPGLFTYSDASEIPAVEDAFDPADYPDELYTTEVRKHAAWAKDFDPDFECPNQGRPSEHVHATATPDMPDGEALADLYDPRMTASLRWIENGAVIHLVGPYPVSQLIELANGIAWS